MNDPQDVRLMNAAVRAECDQILASVDEVIAFAETHPALKADALERVKAARAAFVDAVKEVDTKKPALCQRCSSPLNSEGFCRDETCPHSDYRQHENWTEG